MEVILKAAYDDARSAKLYKGYNNPPLKSFMDDTKFFFSREDEAKTLLWNIDNIVSAAKMQFKPKKKPKVYRFRSKKMDYSAKFRIANQTITTVFDELVKSVGRWHDAKLKDTKRGEETKTTSAEGFETINQCGIQ